MNSKIKMDDAWPPCCCVAAFVAKTLEYFGHSLLDRSELARKLGIRVGPEKANPWDLPIETDPNLQGLLVSDAKQRVPVILKRFDPNLRFRHIPFCTVMFNLYKEVLDQAIKQGCIVAIGFNNAILLSMSGIIRHVARIMPTDDPRTVILIDDTYGTSAPHMIFDWEQIERAVYSGDDGFWIIGPSDRLKFDFVPNDTEPKNGKYSEN